VHSAGVARIALLIGAFGACPGPAATEVQPASAKSTESTAMLLRKSIISHRASDPVSLRAIDRLD
jgi:hypothetical protein